MQIITERPFVDNGHRPNYSDFHFFGVPIPGEYHLYVLADDRYKDPIVRLQNMSLGSCQALPKPRGNTSLRSVEDMVSSNDSELEMWLNPNEVTYSERNRPCDAELLEVKLVGKLSEWGPRSLSNYSLFEGVPTEEDKRNPPRYLYMRGINQKAYAYSRGWNTWMFQIKELRNVWLIASNGSLNFSAPRISDDKIDPVYSYNQDKKTCTIGIRYCYCSAQLH